MKKLTMLLIGLISINASAGFIGDHYSSQKLRFENRCGVPICRANDNGRGFVEYCNFQRQSILRGDLPVYVWYGNGSKCYCPCDLSFENEVTNQN